MPLLIEAAKRRMGNKWVSLRTPVAKKTHRFDPLNIRV
jgi:hypothetical protein